MFGIYQNSIYQKEIFNDPALVRIGEFNYGGGILDERGWQSYINRGKNEINQMLNTAKEHMRNLLH